MTALASMTPIADHGSFTVSLLFLGPVALMLLALCAVTLRDRRRSRDGDAESRRPSGGLGERGREV